MALIFLIAISMILVTYFWYNNYLYDTSHELIKHLQSGLTLDSEKVKFLHRLSSLTHGSDHELYIFFANTMMSRERFWYYLLAAIFGHFMQAYLKMLLHEPRPTEMWTDVWTFGCVYHFGSPSGHSLEICNILLILLFDQFLPSNWSK